MTQLTEKTAKELIAALERNTLENRMIRATEYFHNCMSEHGRFALSPDQRRHYNQILSGEDIKPISEDVL